MRIAKDLGVHLGNECSGMFLPLLRLEIGSVWLTKITESFLHYYYYYYYYYYYPNFSLLSFSWEIFTYPGMYHQQD
jgi:hypothetical protein